MNYLSTFVDYIFCTFALVTNNGTITCFLNNTKYETNFILIGSRYGQPLWGLETIGRTGSEW